MHEHPSELPAGCRLCNVYEHEIPIAEYVMANVLLHVTHLRQYAESFRSGRCDGNGRISGETHDEAHGKTLGLLGYGHIGQAIAARARSFGMPIRAICRDPRRYAGATRAPDFLGGPDALGDVLERSDFFVIACPLTSATRGLLGARERRVCGATPS
jgi:phosphoglycerate dehydrogenase-like enzyme